MTQTRYTLQQHHINLKSSVKLSQINMYHCESPASNIFPGHPYSKIIFIQKGDGQFYFGNQFLPVQENDLLLVNPYLSHIHIFFLAVKLFVRKIRKKSRMLGVAIKASCKKDSDFPWCCFKGIIFIRRLYK